MPKRVKTGDVVEIVTLGGLAYAQYSHKNATYGALIRVFKGIHPVRPSNLAEIVLGEPQFLIFFPLGSAVNQQIVAIVDNLPVPQHAQPFPIFRNGVRDPATNTVNVWWLWDGEKEWRVGALESAQRKFPVLQIVNDTALIEMIETAYSPEDDGFGAGENCKLGQYLNDARLSAASAFGRLTRKFH